MMLESVKPIIIFVFGKNFKQQNLRKELKRILKGIQNVSNKLIRDGFGPGPAQPKSARAYIPSWPKDGPGPKVAQRRLAQIGLGPIFFGPGPAQESVGPDNLS